MDSNYSKKIRREMYLHKQIIQLLRIMDNEIIRGNANGKLVDECLDTIRVYQKKADKLLRQNVEHTISSRKKNRQVNFGKI